ncbi:MAG: amino acid adenylation domain-containing protein [Bacteroidales bacterium]|nr:amino acid adenylation domain-containing protein [Bacteroidales bacterium]
MKQKAPLAQSQYGIYADCVGHEGEAYYNLPFLYVLDGSLDGDRLCRAIETAVKAHPTLFSRIELDDNGEPVQTIDMENEEFSISVEPITDIEAEKQKLIKPFQIYGGRLFNTRLLYDKEHYYWFLDGHHMICDGTSLTLMLHEADKAYKGEELVPEQLTMAEVAIAEAEQRKSSAFEEGKRWYAQHFDCGDTFTQLIPDLEVAEPSESSQSRVINIEMARVDDFCKANGIFKSNFFTMVYSFLLAKYNNEKESLFTTVYNGRTDKRFARSVGMTVKTLPVYGKFTDETTVLDFLKDGQELMSGCRKHEVYSFGDVMQDLNLQSNSMFVWHGLLYADEELMGKPMKTIRLINSTLEVPLYLKAFILDNHYHVKAEYKSNVYSETLIAQFLESYEAALLGFLTKTYLRDIDIATENQIAVLDEFNHTEVEYDASQTIVSLFRKQVAATPDREAVVYQDQRYTYAQVDELSERIAASIVAKGLVTEDVVSVLIPRSEWMVIASLGVLKAGCAYQPLDPSYPKERLNFMMKDANAKLLICEESLRPLVDEYQGEVMFTRDLPLLPATAPVTVALNPDNLFILLYTSGSTGVPKGCQLEHRNLVAFCHWYQRYYTLRPEHKVAAYASYGFDACMMDMYPALTTGAAVYIIPEEIRLDLIALNDYFERQHITHSFMTTQVGFQFATGLENHSLLHLSSGGEKLASMAPPQGYCFHNGYGPTECTIFTTTYPVTRKMKEIPIGKPLDNLHLYVVDHQGYRMPVGASGELWISGPQVSRGYLNRPEKTAEVFIDNPFVNPSQLSPTSGLSRVYRTGDIVRYLPDGNIQFVGRKDGQVKIRGFRIELKEVESIIREFPGIKDATVQAFDEEGGGKFIAAYIVSDQQIDIEELNQFIMDEKPPYMVPAVTMQIEAIPLNQNQKVNKKALPKPEKKAVEAVAESNIPMNLLEEELHEMIAGIVGTKDFGVTTGLGYVGLTSISAIRLAVQLNRRYGVTIDSKLLVKTGSLQSIENEILRHVFSTSTKQDVSETSHLTKVSLSYAQTGVYFDCLKDPTSTIYNIPYLLSYPEGVEAQQLADAVKKVTATHPELSVRFDTEGDSIIQTTEGSEPIQVPVTVMTEEKLAKYKNDFVQPFNLKKSPLCRFEVVKTEKGVRLLMDVHHLAFDGGSADLFIRQVNAALEGQEVNAESYTYFDFVKDQREAEASESFKASEQFFAEKLKTCEGASEIPGDLPKSSEQGWIGEVVCPVDHEKVAAFCRQQEITPAHLFFGATAYAVSRHTNNRDVYCCTISSGRSNLKIADTVGMFVNTLALGLNIEDASVKQYLQSVSETFDETLRHEDYPFARIASDFGFRPAIAYAYQVGVLSEYTVKGKKVEQELLELNVPKFKINIKIESRGVVVQYDDAVYSEALALTLAENIVAAAQRMMENPDGKVRKISILSERQDKVLSHLRQTDTGEAPFRFFHECIGYYAKQQPDRQALVATDASFTYAEMDELTDRIAVALRERGVRDRDRVALLLPRTSRLIVSLFGVLKSGAAYIPCDPEYPADRVKLILEDSEARFIITTADRMDSVPADKAIDVEDLLQAVPSSEKALQTEITPEDLAYLIYTSGSTGRPKGVMLHHRGICNYLYGHPANVLAHAVATDASRMLSVTTISFDAALQDIGHCYFNGKTLVLATEEQANNPLELTRLINEQHIDMVSGTPSRWQTWLTSDDFAKAIGHIRIARAGGEKFSDQLLAQLRSATKARIFNCYGPTETTVASNNKELTEAKLVTVGKPQLNVKEFIVDADGNELPVGVVGELYIGGRGVAHGYNNLPDMTRERFVDYHGEKIYKSGDYAKWLPDGDVVILGRTDHQIKLRGLRIELGEIENVMLKVEGLKKVVILIRNIGGKEHLCAYYTADRALAPETVKAEISKSLTQYMVPTAYLQLSEMPMTPNGKTDVKALPEPELAVSSAYEEPANDTERSFCDIFAGILQMDKVGATDNFFELGGTSLVVTRVIIEADKAGMHVAYGDVFANPTPRKLAALITGETAVNENDPVANFDYTAINNLLARNTLTSFLNGERQQLGNVLLTGATGYLGIHILRQLIDSEAENIYCLVRGKTLEAAESRLKTLLYYYFDSAFKELFGKRLHVVLGDVTGEFGEGLDIDTVFNCAAVVKHFSEGTEIEDVNIGGAKRCVEFCIKTGAKLVHVSTASTRGLSVNGVPAADEVFTEQKLYMGQYLGNKYIFSKYMAERLILDAIALHGLNAKIMRVGNLAARSTDGEFQANFSTNSFMGRIKIYNMLGCCPYAMRNKKVEFSPINEVAKAIVLLATSPKDCCVFHPYNIHTQFLGDVLMGLTAVGEGIRFVEQKEYEQEMERAKDDPQRAKQMASMLAYQDMAHGQKSGDVNRDNDYTTQVLYRYDFAWSPTSWDYVERMLTAIGGLGFFDELN